MKVAVEQTRPRGQIPRTRLRKYASLDHRPPEGRRVGRKAQGIRRRVVGRIETFGEGRWPGTSHEHDKAARRKRNRKSWRKQVKQTWQAERNARRAAAALDEALIELERLDKG
jgi:hypothetical protein